MNSCTVCTYAAALEVNDSRLDGSTLERDGFCVPFHILCLFSPEVSSANVKRSLMLEFDSKNLFTYFKNHKSY